MSICSNLLMESITKYYVTYNITSNDDKYFNLISCETFCMVHTQVFSFIANWP